LISDYIRIQKEKEIKIGLFCMKDEYLNIFQNYLLKLSEIYKKQTNIEIEYRLVFKTYKMVLYNFTLDKRIIK